MHNVCQLSVLQSKLLINAQHDHMIMQEVCGHKVVGIGPLILYQLHCFA